MARHCGEQEPHRGHYWNGLMRDWCKGVSALTVVPVAKDEYTTEMKRHPSWIGEPKMTVEAAVKALDEYITSKHTASFGKQSMVSNPVAREDFIDWFIDVCERTGMIQPTRPEFRQEYPT